MAVSAPPKRKSGTAQEQPPKQAKEKDIEAIINRGSSTAEKPAKAPKIKNFGIKILAETLDEINDLREKRPRKPTSPKLGVSLQDWVIEAIEEKIQREKKKYK